MAYKLTPAQEAGILAANSACREHGIPTYEALMRAAAGMAVAVRDGKPTESPLARLCEVLEGLRNDSATRPPARPAQLVH